MGLKTVLTFEALPKNLPLSKRAILGVFDISGIQKYIFGGITADTDGKDVGRRSLYVSRLTLYILKQLQSRYKILFDFASSGKLYCVFSPKTDLSELEAFSFELQKQVYASTSGRLSLFFAFCETRIIKSDKFDNDKMTSATSLLAENLSREKLRPDQLVGLNMKDYFNETLTEKALVPESTRLKPCDNDCVAVKLDLDNLGAFFGSITSFDVKRAVSIALDKAITEVLSADKRINVILSGGDDIFFICDYGQHYDVISSLYKRLIIAIGSKEELKEYLEKGMFGISAGATRVRGEFGAVPLLYYSESAEKMLDNAKKKHSKNCLCLDGRRLSWEQLAVLSLAITEHYNRLFPDKTTYNAVIKDPALLCDRILKVNKVAHILKDGSKELKTLEAYQI